MAKVFNKSMSLYGILMIKTSAVLQMFVDAIEAVIRWNYDAQDQSTPQNFDSLMLQI